MFLHPLRVFRALQYSLRYRVRSLLRMPKPPHAPVLESGIINAVERHTRICKTLLSAIPNTLDLTDAIVCEVGHGDCIAAADMMLSLGAAHAYLVEHKPVKLTALDSDVLRHIVLDSSLPNTGNILEAANNIALDKDKSTAIGGLLEDICLPKKVDFLYSFDVLEHVEDLIGFLECCHRFLKPGGVMLHKFDLSGHEHFEDPIPPLDFQTYPDWLYSLMFPKYRRATRNLLPEYLDSLTRSNFELLEITVLNSADIKYTEGLFPMLRNQARQVPIEQLRVLDVIIIARAI